MRQKYSVLLLQSHYFGVNLDIVWNIVKEELPGIVLQVEEILRTEQAKESENT